MLSVKGGPVFSLAKVPSAMLDAAANGKKPKVVYCGTANKDILFYNAGATELDDKVRNSVHVHGRSEAGPAVANSLTRQQHGIKLPRWPAAAAAIPTGCRCARYTQCVVE